MANKRHIPSKSFKKGHIPWNKGKKCPQLSGNNNGFFGKKHTDETKEKMKKPKINAINDKNHNWKGKKAKYRTIHLWLVSKKGKATQCTHCGKNGTGHQIHWANIDHTYNRNIDDYFQLCAKCHGKYDKENSLRKSF